jgi:thiamine pyrophosphokinase
MIDDNKVNDLKEYLIKEHAKKVNFETEKAYQKRLTLIKRIIKNNKTDKKYQFEGIIYQNELSYVCNGCFMFELKERYQELEFSNDVFEKLIDKCMDISLETDKLIITKEFINEVKEKARTKDKNVPNFFIKFREEKYCFDAEYFKYALELLNIKEGEELTINHYESKWNPILIECENGRALILPIRYAEEI